jgi:uncharacterized membrane protein YdjX (TVP38/TMEM64 family)
VPKFKLITAGIVLAAMVACPLLLSREIEPIFGYVVGAAREFGPVGAVFVLLLQSVICVVGVLPASIIGIASGLLYGFGGGAAVAGGGTVLGAIGGYYLGRFCGRRLGRENRPGSPVVDRLQGFLSAEGWKSIFLIRLSPVLPFSATSIALGAAGTKIRDYMIGTTASFPALFAYVYLGSVLGSGANFGSLSVSRVTPILLALGLVAALTLAGRYIAYSRSQQ